MTRITAVESITLDGVMQAPGAPDEDMRGAFAHGGWALAYSDEVQAQIMGQGMAGEGGLLLGRRTYEGLMQVRVQVPVSGGSRGERRRDRCAGEACVVNVDEVGVQRPVLAATGLSD